MPQKSSHAHRTFWLWLVRAVAVFSILIGCFGTWQKVRLTRAQAKVSEAERLLWVEGMPMSFEELAVGPPLADEDNAALIVEGLVGDFKDTPLAEAIDQVEEWDWSDDAHPNWLDPWDEMEPRDRQQLTDLLEREDTQRLLACAREAAVKPAWASSVETPLGPESLIPEIGTIRDLLQLLMLKANQQAWLAMQSESEAQRDTFASASYECMLAGLQLAQLFGNNRTYSNAIYEFSRVALNGIACDHLQAINRELPLPKVLYDDFQELLLVGDPAERWKRMADGEWMFMHTMGESNGLLSSSGAYTFLLIHYYEDWEFGPLALRVVTYLKRPDVISGYALYMRNLKTVRTLNPLDSEGWEKYRKDWEETEASEIEKTFVSTLLSVATIQKRIALSIKRRHVIAVGLAVNAYADDHGHLPASLDVLVPDYIPQVPHVDVSPLGDTISYRPEADVFCLWTTGMSGEDQGGRYNTEDPGDGDVVFRGRRAVWGAMSP